MTLEESDSVDENTPSEADPSPSDESDEAFDDERCECDDENEPREAERRVEGKRGNPVGEGARPPYDLAEAERGEGERPKLSDDEGEGVGEKTSAVSEFAGRRGVGGMMRGEARSAVGAACCLPMGEADTPANDDETLLDGGGRIWIALLDRLVGDSRFGSCALPVVDSRTVEVDEVESAAGEEMLTDAEAMEAKGTAWLLSDSGSLPQISMNWVLSLPMDSPRSTRSETQPGSTQSVHRSPSQILPSALCRARSISCRVKPDCWAA